MTQEQVKKGAALLAYIDHCEGIRQSAVHMSSMLNTSGNYFSISVGSSLALRSMDMQHGAAEIVSAKLASALTRIAAALAEEISDSRDELMNL